MSGVDAMRLSLARENSSYRLETEERGSVQVYAPFSRYLLIDDSHWLSYLPSIAKEDDIIIEGKI